MTKQFEKRLKDLELECDILRKDVFRLVQVVRQDRACLQYIANLQASIDATIIVSPRTTGLDRLGVSQVITTGAPSAFAPIGTEALYEHMFDTQVVP